MRADISGNKLTIFLVRARGAAPGGLWTKSTPGKSRQNRHKDAGTPGEGSQGFPERSNGLKESSKRAQ